MSEQGDGYVVCAECRVNITPEREKVCAVCAAARGRSDVMSAEVDEIGGQEGARWVLDEAPAEDVDYREETPRNTPIVLVEWDDITDHSNWNEDSEIIGASVWSLGWLLVNNDQEIIISPCYEWVDGKWASQSQLSKKPPEIIAYYRPAGD